MEHLKASDFVTRMFPSGRCDEITFAHAVRELYMSTDALTLVEISEKLDKGETISNVWGFKYQRHTAA